ncbi:hypothetical protein WL80_23920 [Burkholderia ubonensis]|uniref:phage antirepressor KilAC domain-containing protein n=1 Tax=Burkholderia ubonensis TaxID=101571 RepID=UPI000754589F|nr:phage antirepressor KilAC domain-containing protein [Burkholderia ubonensis]KVO03693.1 hypothetical protein WJ69_26855 [Burkholderia ubonensis]KVO09900.1 hypothetical protein WJ73_21965 [Burkholderia ubonensis]KWE84198.1 hypothetical protein WL80_23920 [Burkholderia ubonensis]
MPTTQMKKGRGADTHTTPTTHANDISLAHARDGALLHVGDASRTKEVLSGVIGGDESSVVAFGGALTMSHREIAQLVESRPDTVKVAMERLRDRSLITFTSSTEKSGGGRPGVVYRVGKRDSYVIVAQLSPEFTARLVDRWQELEAAAAEPKFSVPSTLSGALRLAAEQAELIEAQSAQLKAQEPAVEFARAVSTMEASIGMARMARIIGWGRNRLFEAMRTDGILMRNNLPYQGYMDRGYFRVIEGTRERSNGSLEPTFTTRVTGKGQVFLQRRYGSKAV